jgi:hypothetical protein
LISIEQEMDVEFGTTSIHAAGIVSEADEAPVLVSTLLECDPTVHFTTCFRSLMFALDNVTTDVPPKSTLPALPVVAEYLSSTVTVNWNAGEFSVP